MDTSGRTQIPAILVLFENIAIVCAILGGVFVWLMPYRLTSTTHRIMTFIAVLNGWLILAAIVLGILAIVLARRGLTQCPTTNKRTLRWAVRTLIVTLVWAVLWSLTAKTYEVSVPPTGQTHPIPRSSVQIGSEAEAWCGAYGVRIARNISVTDHVDTVRVCQTVTA